MNNNTAYDFSMFDKVEDPNKNKRIKMLRSDKKDSKRSKGVGRKVFLVLKFVFLIIVGVSLFSSLIIGQVKFTETTAQINDLTEEYQEECSTYTQLSMKIESKLSLAEVEKYADDKLNMIKLSGSQINYIKIQDDDIGYVKKDSEPEWLVTIREVFLNFSELNK